MRIHSLSREQVGVAGSTTMASLKYDPHCFSHSHVAASPFLPSSLPHFQPNVIKSLHFLTCHSQPCPLHSDWPSISPPLLPGDHLGPLSLPGDVFQPSSYLPCQQHPLIASFLDFFYLPLQICASSFHPTLGC